MRETRTRVSEAGVTRRGMVAARAQMKSADIMAIAEAAKAEMKPEALSRNNHK